MPRDKKQKTFSKKTKKKIGPSSGRKLNPYNATSLKK